MIPECTDIGRGFLRPISKPESTHDIDQSTMAFEFASVITCTRCSTAECQKLLRDKFENVPQPGYIGARYYTTRLLLVGQNPGVNTAGLATRDRAYTAALRQVAESPSDASFESLSAVMDDFVPSWPVHGNYFPLRECGLALPDIAYCNAVRCRTIHNATPSKRQAEICVNTHYRQWLTLLEPRVVVFIGKWAYGQCQSVTRAMGIPSAFMNRRRSLSAEERSRNRQEIVSLVKCEMARRAR
jgi:uracil-DNA glycosylase